VVHVEVFPHRQDKHHGALQGVPARLA
jgi:hypothetical protein